MLNICLCAKTNVVGALKLAWQHSVAGLKGSRKGIAVRETVAGSNLADGVIRVHQLFVGLADTNALKVGAIGGFGVFTKHLGQMGRSIAKVLCSTF